MEPFGFSTNKGKVTITKPFGAIYRVDTGGFKNGYRRIQNGYSRLQAEPDAIKQWSSSGYKLDTETTPSRSHTGYRVDPNIKHIVFLSLIMSFRE